MKCATWNVESIRAHEQQVLDWIECNDVDVACLQETRADRRRFPRSGFASLGYDLVIHGGEAGQGGVAVAVRVDLDDIVLGIPGAVAPLDTPRSISFTAGGVRMHTCYAPNGRKVGTHHHELKLAWFALFTAWVTIDQEALGDRLLLGDLNIAPTDLDVWDASRYRKRNLTSPLERQAFERLVTDAELIDAVRHHLGDAPGFTWWNRRSDFYETDRGWRLDHVLATDALVERLSELRVDRAERARPGSCDHAPIAFTIT